MPARYVHPMVLLLLFAGCGTLPLQPTAGRDRIQHQNQNEAKQSKAAGADKKKKNENK